MIKEKPIVFYKEVDFIPQKGLSALITPINHPHCSNTGLVRTSTVITILEDGFETRNSIYKLQKE